MSDPKIYTVALAGSNKMNIINASNGTIFASFTFPGTLVTGPVVAGDKCTYVVKLSNNEQKGFIRKLPHGVVTASFKV